MLVCFSLLLNHVIYLKLRQKQLLLKVRQSRNVSFKPTILPKNERMNSVFLPNSTMSNSFVHFLEEFEDTKKSF